MPLGVPPRMATMAAATGGTKRDVKARASIAPLCGNKDDPHASIPVLTWCFRAALLILLLCGGCALDAPRGSRHDDPENLARAAGYMQRSHTFRMSVTSGSELVSAEVQLPDRYRVSTAGGEWVRRGDVIWSRTPSGWAKAVSAPQVDLVTDAIGIALTLDRATDVRYERSESVFAYPAHVWSFRLNGAPGSAWLTTRDRLPRRIDLARPGSDLSVMFQDIDAALEIPDPTR